MTSLFTLSDGRKLSYSLDTSPPEGPIVLLSNALCSPYPSFDHVVTALNTSGFRTLRYDQPGHGSSSVPERLDSTTFASMADDVHALLQQLQIAKLHAFIGVSMGAAIGVCFVTQYPGLVHKLVICDTISCSPVNEGIEDLFGARVATAREAGNMSGITEATLGRWLGEAWVSANPKEAQRMRNIMMGTTVDGYETCCWALRSATFDLRPLFVKIGASVDDALCVVGEKDANLPQAMEAMRAGIEEGFASAGDPKKTELTVIKNAGHVCYIDGFDQFMSVVTAFLNA